MTEERSGAAVGAENVARLRAYVDGLRAAGERLPERAGKPNVSAIALACGFDRQVLYKNPGARDLLAKAADELGLDASGEIATSPSGPDRRERRIQQLEQENAALRAEVVGMREQIRRLRHVETHMVETGRRVAPLFPSHGETGG